MSNKTPIHEKHKSKDRSTPKSNKHKTKGDHPALPKSVPQLDRLNDIFSSAKSTQSAPVKAQSRLSTPTPTPKEIPPVRIKIPTEDKNNLASIQAKMHRRRASAPPVQVFKPTPLDDADIAAIEGLNKMKEKKRNRSDSTVSTASKKPKKQTPELDVGEYTTNDLVKLTVRLQHLKGKKRTQPSLHGQETDDEIKKLEDITDKLSKKCDLTLARTTPAPDDSLSDTDETKIGSDTPPDNKQTKVRYIYDKILDTAKQIYQLPLPQSDSQGDKSVSPMQLQALATNALTELVPLHHLDQVRHALTEQYPDFVDSVTKSVDEEPTQALLGDLASAIADTDTTPKSLRKLLKRARKTIQSPNHNTLISILAAQDLLTRLSGHIGSLTSPFTSPTKSVHGLSFDGGNSSSAKTSVSRGDRDSNGQTGLEKSLMKISQERLAKIDELKAEKKKLRREVKTLQEIINGRGSE